MPSIWETKKFQVQAHPCDRDYMHLKGMSGCAPIVYNDNSAMGILDMSTRVQSFGSARAPRTKNTQTVQQLVESVANGTSSIRKFISMVGKPSKKDLSNPQYRSTGFLGTSEASPGSFFDCKTVKQCFVDKFTFHGEAVQRMVTTNTGIERWKPLDTDRCGSFGIQVDPVNHPECTGLDINQYACCLLDQAVAPIYRLLCNTGTVTVDEEQFDESQGKVVQVTVTEGALDFLSRRCSGVLNPFSGSRSSPVSISEATRVCSEVGAVYSVSLHDKVRKESELGRISAALNSMLDILSPSIGASAGDDFVATTSCSLAIYSAIQSVTTRCTEEDVAGISVSVRSQTLNPYCSSYHVGTPHSGLYYFLTYTLQELPFAWWHKCMALQVFFPFLPSPFFSIRSSDTSSRGGSFPRPGTSSSAASGPTPSGSPSWDPSSTTRMLWGSWAGSMGASPRPGCWNPSGGSGLG